MHRHPTLLRRLCPSKAQRGRDHPRKGLRFGDNRWVAGVEASHAKGRPSNWCHFQATLLDVHVLEVGHSVALGSRHRRPPLDRQAAAALLVDHPTWFRLRPRHPAECGHLATACVKPAVALLWAVLHLACLRRHRRAETHGRVGLRGARRQGAWHLRLPTQGQTPRVRRHRRHRWVLWHAPVVGVGAEAAALAVPAIVKAAPPDRWTAHRRHRVGLRCGRGDVVAGSALRRISPRHLPAVVGGL